MVKILIVEDNEMDRVLVTHLLSNLYEFVYASNGEEGLQVCESDAPDLVVTDLVMEKMDGMEMLGELQLRHPEIPVIMMTSEGSELTAAQAMDRGAASYVPKSLLPERLCETVNQVVDLMRADRDYRRLLQRMSFCRYTFVLENDFSLIDPLVEFMQQIAFSEGICSQRDRHRLGVALDEAIFNAMYHGNLQLPVDQIQSVRSKVRIGDPVPIVEKRLQDATYHDRRVVVDLKATADELRVVIEDDGAGFDHTHFVGQRGAEAKHHKHRGILLIESIMDNVTYNEAGNRLTLVKTRDSTLTPQ